MGAVPAVEAGDRFDGARGVRSIIVAGHLVETVPFVCGEWFEEVVRHRRLEAWR